MKHRSVVGKKIREVRQEKKITQGELAKRMGYSDKSAISKIETGENDVNMSTVIRFADALGTSKEHLLGWDEQPKDKEPKQYYLDDETAKLAQAMASDPRLNSFLSASMKLNKEDFEVVQNIVFTLLRKDGLTDD